MKKNKGYLYSLPLAVWGLFLIAIPLGIIFVYSFLTKKPYGGVAPVLTLDAYASILNPLFGQVALKTFWMALLTTVFCVLIALPCAYYMARSKYKEMLLLVVIIPFWTNFLIRIYAWIALLGNDGFLNNMLISLGIITADDFVLFLYNQYAVILVLVYTNLPFAILPIYTAIEKFNFSLIEAARDLGASQTTALRKIMLPGIKGGIVTAVLFTFIPSFGAYAVPQLVGGHDSFMLGNVIARELTVARNWPFAAAISTMITLLTMLALFVYMAINRHSKSRALRKHRTAAIREEE